MIYIQVLQILFAVENRSWDKVYLDRSYGSSLWKKQKKKELKTTESFMQWMLTSGKLLNRSNVAQALSEKICFVLKKIYLENQHNIYSEIKEGWLKSSLFHSFFSLKLFHRPAPPSAARSRSLETAGAWGTTSPWGPWSALNAAQATFWRDRAPSNVWQSPTLWPSGTAPSPAASVRKSGLNTFSSCFSLDYQHSSTILKSFSQFARSTIWLHDVSALWFFLQFRVEGIWPIELAPSCRQASLSLTSTASTACGRLPCLRDRESRCAHQHASSIQQRKPVSNTDQAEFTSRAAFFFMSLIGLLMAVGFEPTKQIN